MFAAIRAATVLVLITGIRRAAVRCDHDDETGGLYLDGPRRQEAKPANIAW
jgi:hypothetical protein